MIKADGIEEVTKRLNMGQALVHNKVHKVWISIGTYLRRSAREIAPKDSGDLRDSAFKRTTKKRHGSELEVGFNDEKAMWVHEMPMKNIGKPRASGNGRRWDNGENRFMTKAINRGMNTIRAMILKGVKF